ncbi:MAG TPA: PTS sugar transporter subunit IIA [Myxococcaceae bacterium]|nr:PTS sugar transporter subunit IIA [Myxococcaceae bacterium]
MLLTVREAARLLKVSEEDIYRWVDAGALPYEQVGDRPRFNQAELLEWATARHREVSVDMFTDAGTAALTLEGALREGGVHAGLRGADRRAVLAEVMARMSVPDEDRETLLEVMLAREDLGSTALGGGIAIPHVRHPAVVPGVRPSITLCYLDTPLDLAAPDGQPVHTLFAILSTTVRGHLQLLAKLSSALHDGAFRQALAERAGPEQVLQHAARLDAAFAQARKPH